MRCTSAKVGHKLLRFFVLSLSLLLPLQAQAWSWKQCAQPVLRAHKSPKLSTDVSLLVSQQVESLDRQRLWLQGDVVGYHNDFRITADELIYNRQTEVLEAQGNARLAGPRSQMGGAQIRFDSRTEQARLEDVSFTLLERHGFGSSASLSQHDEYRFSLYDVQYSTCDPDAQSWRLAAREMHIDDEAGLGEAWNTRLYLGDVPIFYFPWVQFPIDDRRLSGLLVPSLSVSDSLGTGISLPWYLNLHPQVDATVTTSNFTRRGLHLGTELRYLSSHSEGQLDLGYIDDKAPETAQDIDAEALETSRHFGRWQHQTQLQENTRFFLNLQEASDTDYLNDFDLVSPVSDQKYLESYVRLHHNTPHWRHEFQAQHFQTLDTSIAEASRPYQRLPHYLAQAEYPLGDQGLSLHWLSDAAYFDHKTLDSGRRLHWQPSLQYELTAPGYFLRSSLSYWLTRYRMDEAFSKADSAFIDQRIADREVHTFSLDGGLIFERLFDVSKNILQTFEPRVMLVNTPYTNQLGLPKFDTKALAVSYQNLFVANRFSGFDRIGDEQRLSLGLSTRFINANNGKDLLSASIGQAFFNDERVVGLNTDLVDPPSRSFRIGTFNLKPNKTFNWRYTIAQDKDIDKAMIRQSTIGLNGKKGKKLSLGYKQKFNETTLDNKLDQKSLSFVWPINQQWDVYGKRVYSSRVHKIKLNAFGVTYEDCCWGLQILWRTEADKEFENKDHGVYLQLVLKGLAGMGRDISEIAKKDGTGYRSPFSR